MQVKKKSIELLIKQMKLLKEIKLYKEYIKEKDYNLLLWNILIIKIYKNKYKNYKLQDILLEEE